MPRTTLAGALRRAGHAVRRAAVTGCAALALALAVPGAATAAVPAPRAAVPAIGAAVPAPRAAVPAIGVDVPVGRAAAAGRAATPPLAGDRLAPASGDRLGEPGVVSDLPSGVPAPPALPAASYVLADLASGEILLAKEAHARRGPASTLKLLTAQTLAPRVRGEQLVRASDTDAAVDGTRVGMVPEAEYTADQLFRAMVMQSANDAAEALARTNGGLEVTLRQMNERAARLGAADTVARTPHGLDAPGQESSAYDLVTILRGALDTPRVAEVLALRTATFPGGGARGKKDFEIAGQNKLLWNYDGAIGGKDGFTDAAGHTYVGAARRGDKTYAVSFMGAASNDWRPTAALLDWAFAHGDAARGIGSLPPAVGPVEAPAADAGAGDGALAAGSDPDGSQARTASAAEAPGMASRLWEVLLATLRVLLGGVAVLGMAAVGLRVRKLRRDERRREERRARQAAADRERLVPVGAATPSAAAGTSQAGTPQRPVRPRSKERSGFQ